MSVANIYPNSQANQPDRCINFYVYNCVAVYFGSPGAQETRALTLLKSKQGVNKRVHVYGSFGSLPLYIIFFLFHSLYLSLSLYRCRCVVLLNVSCLLHKVMCLCVVYECTCRALHSLQNTKPNPKISHFIVEISFFGKSPVGMCSCSLSSH